MATGSCRGCAPSAASWRPAGSTVTARRGRCARSPQLFGDVIPLPPPSGSEAPDELRRWQAGELLYWITGPGRSARSPTATATGLQSPRSRPRRAAGSCSWCCGGAGRPDEGWRLARELTEPAVAVKLAAGFATVPTCEAALAAAPPLVAAIYRALQAAEPLPRDPRTPLSSTI